MPEDDDFLDEAPEPGELFRFEAEDPVRVGPGKLLPLEEVASYLGRSGIDGVFEIGKPSAKQAYKDRSTVLICPTKGLIDTRVVESWNGLIHAMNASRAGPIFARGYEVGEAYTALLVNILEHPYLKTWKYVLTLEDDNLPPPDGHLRLLEVLEAHPEYDAVAGLYHMKDALRLPLAYGDPEHFRATGRTIHNPVDKAKLDPNGPPVEVLGIPMGFTLWRMDLFRQVPPPWFVTLSDQILTDDGIVAHDKVTAEQAPNAKRAMTQDMMFCEIAVRKYGKRFAVAPNVRVGHLDIKEGVIY